MGEAARPVAWEGEPAPAGAPGDRVTYLWHAGTASGYGAHRFTLSLNGAPIATFASGRTTADREWSVAGENGATLSFRTTRVGQFDELFGFMWLTAPRARFGDASPRFEVVSEPAGSHDYYLGPQERVEEWVRLSPEGIAYHFLGKELGGMRKGGYTAYIITEEFRQGIRKLEAVAENQTSVIVCAERFPWKCHRKWISLELRNRGWDVRHIIDKGKVWIPK